MEEDWTYSAWSSECISFFRSMCCPGISCEYKVGRGPYLCRSHLNKFLRWMHHMRMMNATVVTSERCWSGIKEKMPEISKELNWLRRGDVSRFLRRKCLKVILRFWRRRKVGELGNVSGTSWWMKNWFITSWWMKNSWRILWWVPKLVPRLRWVYPCLKLVYGKFCNSVTESCLKNLRKQCCSLLEFYAEIHPSWSDTWEHQHMKVFVRWCNVTGDSTLQPVTTCINIQDSSWRESTRIKFMNIQMKYSKMRSEPIEYMWETTGALVQRLVAQTSPHVEELTEEIDETGVSAIAFYCGTGRDWWRTFIQEMFMRMFRLCLAQMNLRVLHRRVVQTSFRDEFVDSTSKALVTIWCRHSLSLEVEDYDIRRAYFQETNEKLIRIWPERVLNATSDFERRMRHCVEANTTQHCSTIQIKMCE